MRNSLFITATLFLLISCKKDEPSVNLGYTYFPDKIGAYIIYEVDSFVQDEALGPNTDTTYKFQIKEVNRSYFTDNQVRKSIRIERFRKNYNPLVPYSSMQWALTDVWYATKTNSTLEKMEEDVRYLRLVFAVNENEKWNGNSLNVFEAWPYKITSAHLAETVGPYIFDSVATVEQINYSDFVTTKYGLEKYAAGVGMVYKELRLLGKQQSTPLDTPPYDDTVGLQTSAYWYYPDKALIYTQKILSYGTE